MQIGVAHVAELFNDRPRGGDSREALAGIGLMSLDVPIDQGLQLGMVGGWKHALLDEDLAQRFRLVEQPRGHGSDQGVAVDEVYQQGEDAEQEVTVRGRAGGDGGCDG